MWKRRAEIQIEQTLDTTMNMASQFDDVCKKQDRVGDFISLSADPSLFSEGQAARFTHMKKKAELYLIEECPNLRPIILRPGKVFINSWYEKTYEGLPYKRNYTSMDAVTQAIVDELVEIYGEGAQSKGKDREPLLIGCKHMKKDSTEKKQKYSDASEARDAKFKKKTVWDFFTGNQEPKKENK